MHLGEVIKAYRKEHGLSMQAFADKCEVSKGYIAMLEKNVNSKTGEPVTPSASTLIKAARAMNISPADLYEMIDVNRPDNVVVVQHKFNQKIHTAHLPFEIHSEDEQRIIDAYRSLNETGKQKARDYVSDLAEQKKYTEKDTESSADQVG